MSGDVEVLVQQCSRPRAGPKLGGRPPGLAHTRPKLPGLGGLPLGVLRFRQPLTLQQWLGSCRCGTRWRPRRPETAQSWVPSSCSSEFQCDQLRLVCGSTRLHPKSVVLWAGRGLRHVTRYTQSPHRRKANKSSRHRAIRFCRSLISLRDVWTTGTQDLDMLKCSSCFVLGVAAPMLEDLGLRANL